MWEKLHGPFWYAYMEWPNVIDAITNCTAPADHQSRWEGPDRACWDQLDCALTAADASQQAQYSSAATVLGLLPTVLFMMTTSSNDLLIIHHCYPLLAILFALCDPSTILSGLSSLQRPNRTQQARDVLHSTRSKGFNNTMDKFFSIRLPGSETKVRMSNLFHDLILHVIAGGIVAVMAWQALLLGMRRVIVSACWTWHEPFTWVGIGGLIHLPGVITWRLCLGPIDSSVRWSRWYGRLPRSGGNLTLKHPHIARFLDLLFHVMGLMNYWYGTVMLKWDYFGEPAE